MKYKLFTTLLAAGLAGNVFVYGQAHSREAVTERPLIQVIHTPGDKGKSGFVPKRDTAIDDPVRIMPPDNMPCRVPSLAGTERMPIKRLESRMVRPMPNGMPGTPGGRSRVEPAPKKKPE